MPRTRRPLGIREVAERYRLHPQTLRLYERLGLLRPSRSRGNTRQYTPADLERLRFILTLTRDLGVNRAGVEVILNMRDRMSELQEEVGRLQELLRERCLGTAGDGGEALVRASPRSVVPSRGRPGSRR